MGGILNAIRSGLQKIPKAAESVANFFGKDIIENVGTTVARKTGSKSLGIAAGTAAAAGNVLLSVASLPVRGAAAIARAVAPTVSKAAAPVASRLFESSAANVSGSLESAIARDIAGTSLARTPLTRSPQAPLSTSFLRGTPAELSGVVARGQASRPFSSTLTQAAKRALDTIRRRPVATIGGGAAAGLIGATALQTATAPEPPRVTLPPNLPDIGRSQQPGYPLPVLRTQTIDETGLPVTREEPIMTPADRDVFLRNFALYHPTIRQPGETILDTLNAMGLNIGARPPTEAPSATIDIGSLQAPEEVPALPEDDTLPRLQEAFQQIPQPELPDQVDSSIFSIAFPEVQSDLLSIYDKMREDFGLYQLFQQRMKLLNTQITINEEIEKIEQEISNDPDIPVELRQRRLERFLNMKKQITDKITAELKLIAEQMQFIQDEIQNRMGIIQDELTRRESERKFNLELLKLYIENGAVGAMSADEMKAWSQATGVSMRVLKYLAKKSKSTTAYERHITTDANGNQVVYFFNKNNPLAPPIKRVLDKAKVTPQDVLNAQEQAIRVKETLLSMGFTEAEATEEARTTFIRSLPGTLNTGDLMKVLSSGFENPFQTQSNQFNIPEEVFANIAP